MNPAIVNLAIVLAPIWIMGIAVAIHEIFN
jgi:hypothetical protein